MQFDATLNAVWAAMGIIALGFIVRNQFRRRRERAAGPYWLHAVGVALIIAALFPYISATDDVLRVEHLNAQAQQRHGQPEPKSHKQSDDLLRLYELMDSPMIVHRCGICLILCFLSIILLPSFLIVDRIAPSCAGRSPPFLFHVITTA